MGLPHAVAHIMMTLPLQAGHTPLLLAAFYGRTAVVALLLATPGVDPVARTAVRGAGR